MLKRKRLVSFLMIVSLASLILVGCGKKLSTESNQITAVGSTALQPLVEQAASDYQKSVRGLMITIQGGGSGTGLSQVQQKAVTIGDSDVFAEKQDGINANELADHQVAVVGMAPIVNKQNGVKNISMAQLKAIFTGKITNWKQVGGKNLPVTVVNRVKGSGTRKTFEQSVLGKATAMKAQEQDSNGTVQKIISSTPGSISYVSFFFLKNRTVQPLAIDGVQPNEQNVTTNKWKIWSYEHMYTTKNPDKATANFIKYMESKHVQDNLVPKMGYISVNKMKVVKDANNVVTTK